MRRKRVTGRFYVFLVLLLIGGYFVLRELFPKPAGLAMVTEGFSTYTRSVDAVIVRDEQVEGYEGTGRIVYVAAEGAHLAEGDPVCEVYSAGYSEKEMAKLDAVRNSIRAYHEKKLDNIKDAELERLEQKVQANALQVKALVRQKAGGSLLNLERQLEASMAERQEYLRKTNLQDAKLIPLYDEEKKRLGAIESWQNKAVAPRAGVVSFYLDGYEDMLRADNLSDINLETVRAVLDGRKPDAAKSRLTTNVFRMVSVDKWYIILLSSDPDWNPVSGHPISFQMTGFPDVSYTGTVVRAQKSEGAIMAQLEIRGELGPLINQRKGKAEIGAQLSGLIVPLRALTEQAGQQGVWLSDVPGGGTFIPVEVLSRGSGNALIKPIREGTLGVGQRVLTK